MDFLVETKESEAVAKEALLLRIQHNAMKAAPVHPSLSKDPKVRVEWLRVSKAVNSPDAKFPSPVADKPAGLSPVKYRGHEVEVRVAVEEEAVEEFLKAEGEGEEVEEGTSRQEGICRACGRRKEAGISESVEQEERERARKWALFVWQHTLVEWKRRSLLRVIGRWHLAAGLGVALAALDKVIKKKKKEITKAEAAKEEMQAQKKATKKAQTAEMMALESTLTAELEAESEAALRPRIERVGLLLLISALAKDSDKQTILAVASWRIACRLDRAA